MIPINLAELVIRAFLDWRLISVEDGIDMLLGMSRLEDLVLYFNSFEAVVSHISKLPDKLTSVK